MARERASATPEVRVDCAVRCGAWHALVRLLGQRPSPTPPTIAIVIVLSRHHSSHSQQQRQRQCRGAREHLAVAHSLPVACTAPVYCARAGARRSAGHRSARLGRREHANASPACRHADCCRLCLHMPTPEGTAKTHALSLSRGAGGALLVRRFTSIK